MRSQQKEQPEKLREREPKCSEAINNGLQRLAEVPEEVIALMNYDCFEDKNYILSFTENVLINQFETYEYGMADDDLSEIMGILEWLFINGYKQPAISLIHPLGWGDFTLINWEKGRSYFIKGKPSEDKGYDLGRKIPCEPYNVTYGEGDNSRTYSIKYHYCR
ncbi:MAG TPA: hypothetical protein EYN67_00815 [Flavobacteriales bacterium]|nr:hypothetical protein [Flavobacteriales bacterium]